MSVKRGNAAGVLAFGALALAAVLGNGRAGADSPAPVADDVAAKAMVGSNPVGQSIYADKCSGCHGRYGEGGGGVSLRGLMAPRAVVAAFIKTGMQGRGMPAFDLPPDQLDAVAEYALTLGKIPVPVLPNPVVTHVDTSAYRMEIRIVSQGFDQPFGMAVLPNGGFLVTERHLGIKRVDPRTGASAPVEGGPDCPTRELSLGGLRDIKLDPDFSRNGYVYLAYECPADVRDKVVYSMVRIGRGTYRDGRIEGFTELWPRSNDFLATMTGSASGGRIAMGDKGDLYFTIGGFGRNNLDLVPPLNTALGKVHRIMRDGSIPADNPYVSDSSAIPSIWATGVRSSQGLVLHPTTHALWLTDHGEAGGDELNLIKRGANYGWPTVSWGPRYENGVFRDGGAKPGTEQPVINWTPAIAVSAATVYLGRQFPLWNQDLLIGSLRAQRLERVSIADGKAVLRELLLEGRGRIRDIQVAGDGAIYVLTERADQPTRGEILKITQAKARLQAK